VLEQLTEPGDLSENRRFLLPQVGKPELGAIRHPVEEAALAAGAAAIKAILRGERATHDRSTATFGYVTLDRVARKAGISRRQIYRLWQTQADFRLDLVDHLADLETIAFNADFDGVAMTAVGSTTDPGLLALHITEGTTAHREVGGRPTAHNALLVELHDPDVLTRRKEMLVRANANLAQRFELLQTVLGVQLRPGLEAADVGTMIANIGIGSERVFRIDPEAIRTRLPWRGGAWSSHAILSEAIVTDSIVS
jgi:AcrR family transcriptional regulator